MSFSNRIPEGHPRPTIDCGEGLTEQHHKESCDIHVIMRKAERTGILSHVRKFKGEYMNMATAPDFKTAQDTIAQAKSMFETVPSRIRNKFHNDPAEFLTFMQDDSNYDAIVEMGFDASHLTPPAPPEPPVPPAPSTPPEPPPAQ